MKEGALANNKIITITNSSKSSNGLSFSSNINTSHSIKPINNSLLNSSKLKCRATKGTLTKATNKIK
jgi:hypothetical protein